MLPQVVIQGGVDHAIGGPGACRKAPRVGQVVPMRFDSQPRQRVRGVVVAPESEYLVPRIN